MKIMTALKILGVVDDFQTVGMEDCVPLLPGKCVELGPQPEIPESAATEDQVVVNGVGDSSGITHRNVR